MISPSCANGIRRKRSMKMSWDDIEKHVKEFIASDVVPDPLKEFMLTDFYETMAFIKAEEQKASET